MKVSNLSANKIRLLSGSVGSIILSKGVNLVEDSQWLAYKENPTVKLLMSKGLLKAEPEVKGKQ